MPKLNPLPTRILSDIEGIAPLLSEATEWARTLSHSRTLGNGEHDLATDIVSNLQAVGRLVNLMRNREENITADESATPDQTAG